MFQSDDFDEDFLNYALEPNDTNKKEEFNFNPAKEICPKNVRNKPLDFAVPSTSRINENNLHVMSKTKNDSCVEKSNCNWQLVLNRKNSDNNRKVVQRKFPGPAGLLSRNNFDIDLKNLDQNNSLINKTVEPDEIICSQISANCFKESPWIDMCKSYYIEDEKWYLPEKYSISWAKTKAMSKQLLGQKTPFLAAIIKSIDYSVKNPMVVLKDPTGEMSGTIHHEVWDEHSEKLTVGSVIVLRQVGVLTTLKKYYLNITANNIITIYHNTDPSSQNYTQTKKLEVYNIKNHTTDDIKTSIEDFRREFHERRTNNSVEKNDNPFFRHNISINSPVFSSSSYSNQNFSMRNVNSTNTFLTESFQTNMQKENNYNIFNPLIHNSLHKITQVTQNLENSNIISASEKDMSFKDILRKTREQNNITENHAKNENNFQELFKKRKLETSHVANNLNIQSNSCNVISGTPEIITKIKRFENRNNNIFHQKQETAKSVVNNIFNASSFKFSSKNVENIGNNINNMASKNDGFFTSTQNSVDVKSVFSNENDLLDGLEESFLEDF